MKVNDTEARYTIAPQISQLIGEVVGSPAVGDRILNSIVQPGERATNATFIAACEKRSPTTTCAYRDWGQRD